MKVFETEAELAAVLVTWLQDQEWEVFQEVAVGGWIADIVARRGRILWAIETKLSFGVAVVEQAARWRHFAHYASAAVPHVANRRGRSVLLGYCRLEGIGILEIRNPEFESYLQPVNEYRPPRLERRIVARIERHLHDEQKTFAPAGNAGGQRFSPFKATCKALADHVRRHPGGSMRQAVDAISHHYSTSATAKSALMQWIRRGAVPGVRLDESTKPISLHPEELT